MSNTYASGQYPALGDIIKCVNFSGLVYYSPLKRNGNGYETKYEVLEVINDLVKVAKKGDKNALFSYKPGRFELVSRADASAEKIPVVSEVVILDESYSLVARTTNDKVRSVLENLLAKNVTKTYHVFKYSASAKTKKPEVIFVEMNAQPEVKSPQIINNPALFSKK